MFGWNVAFPTTALADRRHVYVHAGRRTETLEAVRTRTTVLVQMFLRADERAAVVDVCVLLLLLLCQISAFFKRFLASFASLRY